MTEEANRYEINNDSGVHIDAMDKFHLLKSERHTHSSSSAFATRSRHTRCIKF